MLLWLLIYIILFVFGCAVNALLLLLCVHVWYFVGFWYWKDTFLLYVSIPPAKVQLFFEICKKYAKKIFTSLFPYYLFSFSLFCLLFRWFRFLGARAIGCYCLYCWSSLSSLSPKLSKWSLINHCLHCWLLLFVLLIIYPFSAAGTLIAAQYCLYCRHSNFSLDRLDFATHGSRR